MRKEELSRKPRPEELKAPQVTPVKVGENAMLLKESLNEPGSFTINDLFQKIKSIPNGFKPPQVTPVKSTTKALLTQGTLFGASSSASKDLFDKVQKISDGFKPPQVTPVKSTTKALLTQGTLFGASSFVAEDQEKNFESSPPVPIEIIEARNLNQEPWNNGDFINDSKFKKFMSDFNSK